MKKKVVMMVVTMAMAAAMMTGCGAKGDTASQTTQESQTADASTMSGTLDEVKDFMFVVTDAQGASYAFISDAKPCSSAISLSLLNHAELSSLWSYFER